MGAPRVTLTVAVTAALTLVAARPAAAADPHPPAKTAAAPQATRPDKAGEKAAEKAPVKAPDKTPAAARPASPANLAEVGERIHRQLAEVTNRWEDTPSRAPARPAPRAAQEKTPERLRLVWRLSLTWPEELQAATSAP